MPTLFRAACLTALLALAQAVPAPAAADEFLPPEAAYQYTLDSDGRQIVVHWKVEPGYYLYRKRMGVATPAPGMSLGEPVYPQGEMHTDEYFGEQEIFRGRFDVAIPVTRAAGGSAAAVLITLKLQGCADAGLCYPPMSWETRVDLPAAPTGIDAVLAQARGMGGPAAGGDEFLDPDVAFRLAATAEGPDRVRLVWEIAPGYYLYRNRLKFELHPAEILTGPPEVPAGIEVDDPFLGKSAIFRDRVTIHIPFAVSIARPGHYRVRIVAQGCAEDRICYSPFVQEVAVNIPPGYRVMDFPATPAPPAAPKGFPR